MSRNKIIINITIIGIFFIVLIPTLYLITKEHNARLRDVSNKRITEAAKNCYLKEKCKNSQITLKELYEKGFLKKESNPITKEFYNELSYVTVQNKEYKFVEVK